METPFISVYVRANKPIFCVGKFRYLTGGFPWLRQMVAGISASGRNLVRLAIPMIESHPPLQRVETFRGGKNGG